MEVRRWVKVNLVARLAVIWLRLPVIRRRLLITLGVPLILRIADHVSANATCCGTDRRTFQAAPALIANDAADGRTAERTQDGACLSIRS